MAIFDADNFVEGTVWFESEAGIEEVKLGEST